MENDKLEGKTKEFTGSVKEKTGALTGNEELEAEGKGDQIEGKTQKFVGEVKDKAEDLKDKVT
ncbi:MAG: CsbD family protein [Tepidiformaceae bacterium]